MFEELGGYKDSADLVKNCQYQQAMELLNDGLYEKAIASFENLDRYSDSSAKATEARKSYLDTLIENKQYTKALPIVQILNEQNALDNQERLLGWCTIASKMEGKEEYVSVQETFNIHFQYGENKDTILISASNPSHAGREKMSENSACDCSLTLSRTDDSALVQMSTDMFVDGNLDTFVTEKAQGYMDITKYNSSYEMKWEKYNRWGSFSGVRVDVSALGDVSNAPYYLRLFMNDMMASFADMNIAPRDMGFSQVETQAD